MKVLLTGASGFVGSRLTQRLERAGHVVLTLGRAGARYDWSDDSLRRGVDEADGVVHLAGENLSARRWTATQKQVLWSSRVTTTRRLAKLLAEKRSTPFVSASAIGFYGDSLDATFNESSPRGQGFLADLCADWEAATEVALEAGVRTAIVRCGLVLGSGGALAKMLPPFKLGAGGPLGSGKQWISWVHLDDVCALYQFLLETPKAAGIYNGTSPNPVTMGELARTLGKVLHRPALFAVPAVVLRLALGEFAEALLTGQKVLPRRTLEAGFHFEHAELEPALRDVLASHERPSAHAAPGR